MSGKVAKKAPRKKGANGYKLPDPIPKGEILTDMKKEQWIVGTSIGVGGFGEIYSAASYKGKTPSDYNAVVKIEPHGNGPLFVEMHFYMRNANPTEIDTWKRKNKFSELGMPRFLGSGSHECNQTKYRFVVMDRYGTDLWKLFLENDRKFPEHTVYKVAWQIINVLEYMHHKTYVHADIKGGNLLLGLKSPNQVFLVDFGLASHINTKTEYKVDPRKAHNGTIEYTSRDAHMGIPTVRGDLEILAYNIVQWLCGSLPWEKNLNDKIEVHKQKEKAFDNPKKFLETCFSGSEVPEPVSQFMTLLSSMKFTDAANYQKFRDILVKGLQKLGETPEGKLEFKAQQSNKTQVSPKKAKVEAANGKRTRTPVGVKKTKAAATRSPKTKKDELPMDALNSSIDSVVMDEKCMTGEDMRRKLISKIDSDAEYEVQIRKRKTKRSVKDETPTKSNNAPKRGRKNVTKKRILDDSLESEPEVKPTKGTRSRPGPKSSKSSETKAESVNACDSDMDMFEDM